MLDYSLPEWLFFFYIYCIIGWIWECTYCSIIEKKLINRGFMRGPVIPIYGCGACTMLVASIPFSGNYLAIFLSGMICASILEYCTGALMEKLFNVRYWDYSNFKINLNGYICLYASVGWGFATIITTQFVHKPVEKLAQMIPYKTLEMIVFICTFIFAVDFALSFKAAIDLKNILIKMDAMKAEVLRMQKRVDVILAFAGDEKDQQLLKFDELVKSVENKLIQAKGKIELSEEVKEEIALLKAKISLMKDRVAESIPFRDFMSRAIIKGNPGIVSSKFKESLEELKQYVNKTK